MKRRPCQNQDIGLSPWRLNGVRHSCRIGTAMGNNGVRSFRPNGIIARWLRREVSAAPAARYNRFSYSGRTACRPCCFAGAIDTYQWMIVGVLDIGCRVDRGASISFRVCRTASGMSPTAISSRISSNAAGAACPHPESAASPDHPAYPRRKTHVGGNSVKSFGHEISGFLKSSFKSRIPCLFQLH